jgi:hypothetical protein
VIAVESVPILSKDVVIRREADGAILFQVHTDEMHFISTAALGVIQLCDGSRTVSQIGELVPNAVGEALHDFIDNLQRRAVLEIWKV